MSPTTQQALHDELEKIGWVPLVMGAGRALMGGLSMLRGAGAAKGIGSALRGASTLSSVGGMLSKKAPQFNSGFTQAAGSMMKRNPFG